MSKNDININALAVVAKESKRWPTTGEIAELRYGIIEAAERLNSTVALVSRLIELHPDVYCNTCASAAPCPTRSALDALPTANLPVQHNIIKWANLGQYRTKYTCSCGYIYIHDGHSDNPEILEDHIK